jgi:hypothetical protein
MASIHSKDYKRFTVFVSHATEDKDVVRAWHEGFVNGIEKAAVQKGIKADGLLSRMEIFISSSPNAIAVGNDWFETLMQKLDETHALLPFITSNSVSKRWVWFEVGYFWNRMRKDKTLKIYPYIEKGLELPSPLNIIQGANIGGRESFASPMGQQFVTWALQNLK